MNVIDMQFNSCIKEFKYLNSKTGKGKLTLLLNSCDRKILPYRLYY